MKQTVTFCDFRDAFRRCDRLSHFSYDGAKVLFDYIEEMEDSLSEELELDVVALCCDYAEDTPKSVAEDYDIDISECDNDDAIRDTVIEYLEDEGAIVGTTDTTIVYRQF
jgi:hypothetical protein